VQRSNRFTVWCMFGGFGRWQLRVALLLDPTRSVFATSRQVHTSVSSEKGHHC
jgi:hypothetical protein